MNDNNTVITISRQYGSGGRIIGEQVAKRLNIPFYDEELINLAAEKSGYHVDFIKKNEQKISNSLLYSLAVGQYYANGGSDLPVTDKIYIVEKEIIESIAKDGPCVIVGRCADYFLKDKVKTFNIFLCGDYEARVKRIKEVYKLDRDASISQIKKNDKARANHYNHFTDEVWGKAENYDMVINTSTFGIDKTAEIISELYKHI
ncbi:MAG: cytidylate kinase-like family protein [Clostridiales bacterium]|nr:cytidylate kinase-like family protein [Clostridiales bacterium]